MDDALANPQRDGLRNVNQSFQIDLREDVLQGLGDVFYLYTSPNNGGLITGWTVVAKVRDRERLQRVTDRLLGMLRAFGGGNDAPAVRRMA